MMVMIVTLFIMGRMMTNPDAGLLARKLNT